MSIQALLGRLEPFAHLQAAHLELLAGAVENRSLPAGTSILKEGERSEDAFVISGGRVRIQRQTPYGAYALAILGAGELFGEAAFVDSNARSSDAIAESATELLLLRPAVVGAIMESDQRFAIAMYWAFWKSLARKLRRTNDLLAQFFAHGGPAPTPPPPRRQVSGEFRIDIAAKRTLFQEQKLSSMEINFLSSLSREKKLAGNEVLFREGEAGDRMYVVLDGRIMISKYIPGAGEEALAFMERGDYFGEMALIDHQPRSADAKAHDGGAVVLAIPREVVEGLLDIHKVSSLRLLKILCALVAKRLRDLDDKIIGWHILAGGGGAAGPPEDQL
jgi:CRP/FNR family transcriptional regulator, cyclic AMP receptor protein